MRNEPRPRPLSRFILIFISAVVAMVGLAAAPAQANPPIQTVATDGLSQTGSGYYSQSTVYDQPAGKYYTFYLAAGGVTKAVAYDLVTKTYGTPQAVATVGSDYHFYASAVIDSAGYIHVFHGMHNSDVKYSKSVNPHNISSWTTTTLTATNSGTYPFLFVDQNDVLTAFYRAGGGSTNGDKIEMARSVNSGTSWTFTTIVDLNDPAGVNGNYLYAERSQNGAFHIAMAQRNGSTESPQDFKNILYFRSLDGGTTWSKRDGSPYTLPVSYAQADKVYMGQGVFVSSIDTDSSGNPYILYSKQNIAILDWFDSAQLYLAHWDGTAWVHQLVNADQKHKYHARLKINTADDFEIYVPKKTPDGWRHIIVGYTSQDGQNFAMTVIADDGSSNYRAPQLPREKAVPARILNFHSVYTLYSVDLDLSGQNVALGATATASDTLDPVNLPPAEAIDGSTASESRWTSANVSGPHWLTVTFSGPKTVRSAVVHNSWKIDRPDLAISNWVLQSWTGSSWVDIPGTTISGNTSVQVSQTFTTPVTTTAIRFYTPDNGYVRIRELMLLGQ